ncbi:ketohexokinase, putative [Paecilomyces variotii No. 5]|uniref:Ketohexokinase, putative n=1 Tax=Byssochlamys spectabilis (strain No. 5 / NBRC 109023) TaxID=1356009 RepID=V5G5W0_BYSSN|nr:ketohexokinase, putative [Paecilomyces variotii No. 5]
MHIFGQDRQNALFADADNASYAWVRVDHYPGEDEKLRASCLARRRGGNCPNTVEVLEQLIQTKKGQQKEKNGFEPLSPVLVAVLPAQSSPAVQFVRDSFGPNVDLTHCLYREAFHEPASSYIISSQATSSRTIVNYNELPEMTHDEFNALIDRLHLQNSGDGTWFHFEGRIPDVNLQNVKSLRTRLPAATISVEAEKPGRPGLPELAAEADVVFYAKGWAQVCILEMTMPLLDAQADTNRDTHS